MCKIKWKKWTKNVIKKYCAYKKLLEIIKTENHELINKNWRWRWSAKENTIKQKMSINTLINGKITSMIYIKFSIERSKDQKLNIFKTKQKDHNCLETTKEKNCNQFQS